MMLLFVENSGIAEELKDIIRTKVGEQFSQTWQGKRVDRAFVQSLGTLPSELVARLDAADRLGTHDDEGIGNQRQPPAHQAFPERPRNPNGDFPSA